MIRRFAVVAGLVGVLVAPASALPFEWPGKVAEARRLLAASGTVDLPAGLSLLRSMDGPDALGLLTGLLERASETRAAAVSQALFLAAELRFPSLGPAATLLAVDSRTEVRSAAVTVLPKLVSPEAARPVLRRALMDAEPSVRISAIAALVRLDGPEATPDVLPLFEDDASEVRERVIASVGAHARPESLAALLERTVDDDATIRRAALMALATRAAAVPIDLLVASLGDPDPDVRGAAVSVLGRGRASEAVAPLAGLLAADEHPVVKRRAAAALGAIGSPDAIVALEAALRLPTVRTAAADALREVGPVALPTLRRALLEVLGAGAGPGSADLIQDLVEAVGGIASADAVPVLQAVLASPLEGHRPGDVERIRVEALRCLARLARDRDGVATAESLGLVLGAPSARIRAAAVHTLAAGRDAGARAVLVAGLKDESPEVVLASLQGLAEIGGDIPTAEVTRALSMDDDAVATAAAATLGRAGGVAAASALLAALRDEREAVRRAAGIALLDLRGEEVAARLLVDLRSPAGGGGGPGGGIEAGAREASLRGLGASLRDAGPPDRAVLDVLIGVLSTEDRSLVVAAAWALAFVGAEDAAPVIADVMADAPREMRLALLELLARLEGPRSLRSLRAAAERSDPPTRALAAWHLGRRRDAASTPLLVALLDDSEPSVRINAAVALARIGYRDDRLERIALWDPDPHARANACLAMGAGEAGASSVGERCLSDPSALVRASGVRALAESLGVPEDGATSPAPGPAATALKKIAAHDESAEVRDLALDALGGRLPAWRRSPRRSWMLVAVPGRDGEALPGREARILLPTGEIRATRTDLHGILSEFDVGDGTVRWSLPDLRPKERRRPRVE